MRVDDIVAEVKRFGVVRTIEDLGLRGLKRLVAARVLKGLTIASIDAESLKCDLPYASGFLSEALLSGIVRDYPEYEMSESFVRDAFARGDECYGFLDGSVLANYGWYSNRPTAIDVPGLALHFDERFIYMYKAFTREKYRGQGLHAIAMARALEVYLAKRYKGFVSYVERNNFSALKSCYRIGYSDFGNIYVARIFGRYMTHAGRGCARYGFRLEHESTEPSSGRSIPLVHPGAPADQSR